MFSVLYAEYYISNVQVEFGKGPDYTEFGPIGCSS